MPVPESEYVLNTPEYVELRSNTCEYVSIRVASCLRTSSLRLTTSAYFCVCRRSLRGSPSALCPFLMERTKNCSSRFPLLPTYALRYRHRQDHIRHKLITSRCNCLLGSGCHGARGPRTPTCREIEKETTVSTLHHVNCNPSMHLQYQGIPDARLYRHRSLQRNERFLAFFAGIPIFARKVAVLRIFRLILLAGSCFVFFSRCLAALFLLL